MVLGLYDQQGLLRFSGRDLADCLAYAELFALADGSFSLESLVHEPSPEDRWVQPASS
ncbi:hypothetical protein KUL97_12430 [Synechococcus sp. HK05]|uniref:hypothetical protein n=1 Tax=Synechococcus sp. HK05 TaxID=2725975 RepID=UPI001C38B7E4|nr:hypothetical protein [Synechococcus sp. HK05]MBV2352516.1 hypothetical protein [Synechococcus sp. HK05]